MVKEEEQEQIRGWSFALTGLLNDRERMGEGGGGERGRSGRRRTGRRKESTSIKILT